jgi:hypothetical protein
MVTYLSVSNVAGYVNLPIWQPEEQNKILITTFIT